MQLQLFRKIFTPDFTHGELHINGSFFAHTLEDTYRLPLPECSHKIAGKTAIEYGTYPVVLSPSARFKKVMPEVINVPCFSGIRIHGGNTSADTLGCILIGLNSDNNGRIWNCAPVIIELIEQLKGCTPHTITVTKSALV